MSNRNFNLSILIPTHKRPTEFGYLITSLLTNIPKELDYEVIVLNNNSEEEKGYVDNHLHILSKYTNLDVSKVKVYDGIPGYSEVWFRPKLIELSSKNYIWFIDDDCIIDTYGIKKLFRDVSWIQSDVYTINGNKLFYKDKIYNSTDKNHLNLYDVILKKVDVEDFKLQYPSPDEHHIGGDKLLLNYILNKLSSNNRELAGCNYTVINNLYRQNGDNLMIKYKQI